MEATPTGQTQTPWGRVVVLVSLVAVGLSLLITTFTWPGARGEAEGLTIAVTGDAELVDGFLAGAEGGLGEVVDLTEVDSREQAVEGIHARDHIGALVLGADGSEVLTASANGQVPATFMSEMASQMQTMLDSQVYSGVMEGLDDAVQAGVDPTMVLGEVPETLPQVAVTDLVPYSDGDPNGVGATAAAIPLTVGALLAGIAIAYAAKGRWQRIGAVLGLGAGGGLLLTLVLNTWLGVYPGGFGIVWLALGLSLTATSSLFGGLYAALGKVGIGIAAVLTLFAAMPWAAFAVPHQFLPAGLGHIGQWMIPGATSTLTRIVSYFPDASATGPWLVLTAWAILGLGLALIQRHSDSTQPGIQDA